MEVDTWFSRPRWPVPFLAVLRWAALFGLAAIAYHSLAPSGLTRLGAEWPSLITHVIGYAALGGTVGAACQQVGRFWFLGAILVAYAAVMEIAQHWSPGRTPRIMDFGASALGVGMGILLVWLLMRVRDKSRRVARQQ